MTLTKGEQRDNRLYRYDGAGSIRVVLIRPNGKQEKPCTVESILRGPTNKQMKGEIRLAAILFARGGIVNIHLSGGFRLELSPDENIPAEGFEWL